MDMFYLLVCFLFFLFLSGNPFLVNFVGLGNCSGIFCSYFPSAESTAYVPNVFPLKIFTCVSKKMESLCFSFIYIYTLTHQKVVMQDFVECQDTLQVSRFPRKAPGRMDYIVLCESSFISFQTIFEKNKNMLLLFTRISCNS